MITYAVLNQVRLLPRAEIGYRWTSPEISGDFGRIGGAPPPCWLGRVRTSPATMPMRCWPLRGYPNIMTCLGRRNPLMRRVALALGLMLPSLDQVSDAFVFHAPVPTPSTASRCCDHAAVESVGSTSNCLLQAWSSRTSRAGRNDPAPDRQRHQGQVGGVCLIGIYARRVCCMQSSEHPRASPSVSNMQHG